MRQVWNVALASRRIYNEMRLSYALAKRLDRENFGVEAGGLVARRIRSSPRLAMQVSQYNSVVDPKLLVRPNFSVRRQKQNLKKN